MLKNAFDAFDQEKLGFIEARMVGTILGMLGHQLDDQMLADIIAEVDEDGSGQIEFEEFCTLAARFLVEEDAEAMQQELKEAFRLYDKEGNQLEISRFFFGPMEITYCFACRQRIHHDSRFTGNSQRIRRQNHQRRPGHDD